MTKSKCPVCGQRALYSTKLGRYFHANATGNRKCWLDAKRTDPPRSEHPEPQLPRLDT